MDTRKTRHITIAIGLSVFATLLAPLQAFAQ